MDPNANLEEQRRIVAEIIAVSDRDGNISIDDAIRLAELVQALDGWLCSGGFLPRTWERK